ncbi:MAG TPA: hypothetical protein VMO26_10215 [Vicinamibacterales bacterium]|nr:hypothetical protein [Vicinamibacterales bacterium]
MLKRLGPAVVGIALLCSFAGCVSTHMKQFIGKDARVIQVQDGPPIAVFDLPDGRRALQYRIGGGTVTLPQTTTTNGQVQLIGDQAWYSQQAITTGGQTFTTDGCLVTYFALWDTTANGWIVKDIYYPRRLVC